MLTAEQIVAKADSLRARSAKQDRYHEEILAVCEGRWEDVFPGMLPEDYNRPFVANMISVALQDTSEVIAPLPSFQCSAAQSSDRARAFADKKTKIVNYAVSCSNLQAQMYSGAQRALAFGFIAFQVLPDFDEQMPKILIDNTFRAYYQNSAYGDKTLFYCRPFWKYVDELILEYPEAADQLRALKMFASSHKVEVWRWSDKDQEALVVKQGAILLKRIKNPIGKCLWRVVETPKLGDCVRGQYDDAIGVQAARTQAQTYALQAMDEAVNAPIAVPNDVQDIAVGPKAVMHSDTPEKLRRVDLNIPPGVFAEAQNLTAETRVATRYPEGRSGEIDASIITGQGVEALMGSFSTQRTTIQMLLAGGLEYVLALWLEMDEKLWPNVRKTVRGRDAGSPYEVTYTPAQDIKGDYTCEVSYGMTAGLDPNRATVFILQNLAAGLMSKDTAMRQLPVDMAVEEEKKKIDIEMQRDALTQAIAGYAQAIPMMATQGMDPAQAVGQIAEVIRLRDKGRAIEEAVSEVFAPPEPPPDQGAPPPPGMPGQPGGEVYDQQTGLPPDIAPGQAQYGPGGQPDLQTLLAGLTQGGQPNLQASVSKRIPA